MLTLTLFSVILHTTFNNLIIQKTTLFEVSNRLNLNNLIADILHFSWTNINYLYSVLPMILIFLLKSYIKRLTRFIQLNIILFFVYSSYTLVIDLFPSHSSLFINNNLLSYNVLLINSLNKYHPLILYICLVYSLLANSLKNTSGLYSKIKTSELYILLIIFTLALGSWWAYQEGSWGGWWNWDPSEMFGLLIMSVLLYSRHYHTTKLNVVSKKYSYLILNITLILFYTFLQLNFDLISHNFGLRDQNLVDIRILYFIMLVVILTLLNYKLKFFKSKNLTESKIVPSIFTIISLIIITAIFSISLLTLFNDIFWRIVRINVLNINVDYKWLLIALLIITLKKYLTNFTYQYITLISLITLTCPLLFLLLPLSLSFIINSTFWSHSFIALLSLKYIALEYTSSNWSINGTYVLNYSTNTFRETSLNYLSVAVNSISYPFLTEYWPTQNNINLGLSNSNIFYNSTSPEFKTFNIYHMPFNSIQSLFSDSENWFFQNEVSTTQLNLLYAILCLLFYTLSRGWFIILKVQI